MTSRIRLACPLVLALGAPIQAMTVLPETPTAAQIAAAIASDRAALTSFAAQASIEWSTGVRHDVLVAWHDDRARWREDMHSSDGTLSNREAMVDAESGVGWCPRDADASAAGATKDALRASRATIERWSGIMPGGGYLDFLEYYPVGTEAQRSWNLDRQIAAAAAAGHAQVRPEQESVEGQPCWVVDLFHPQGHVDRTLWIAAERNWVPARSIQWDSDGGVVREQVILEWMPLSPDRWTPSRATASLPVWNHVATMELVPTTELPAGASLLPSDSLLPADPREIVPSEFVFSTPEDDPLHVAALAPTLNDPALAARDDVQPSRVPFLSLAAGGVGLACLAVGLRRRAGGN